MKTTAVLTLSFRDERARDSLAAVLAPDNRDLPRSLSLSVETRGTTMEIAVASDSPSTSLSTTLGFLGDIALFEEVWLLSHGSGAGVHRGRSS